MADGRDHGRIVLVRHGETEWSATGRHTSRTDLALTARGRAEAVALRPVLARFGFGLVLSSPMRRSHETCRLAGLDASVEVEPDLREWDYGEYEGLTTPEIRVSVPAWRVWTHPSPGGETAEAVTTRADRVLGRCRPVLAEGHDVALVGHGHMSRVIAARWLGLGAADGMMFALDAGSVSVLGHERETPVVESWNLRPALG
jgi:broad specificity phosphatase PhoE